ncbi:MAG: DUF2169 domain-containing protein [Deltaproteobacteria bacterium]|jgi:hypothetical protein|nr:DUF2169 domain-containing protein [Deltaproteobacteria bacterium]MBW2535431.1 DUF2169 domain-containing protein [Deltaproteobacteria bacterium]
MSEPYDEPEGVALVAREDGRLALAGVVRRTYSIRSGRAVLADEQPPLVDVPVLATGSGASAILVDDSDIVAPKIATDIVVRGQAYAPEPTRRLTIGVAVGAAVRTLEVVGERHASVSSDGQVGFSPPEPFEQLELSYEHAYGGYDQHAHQVMAPLDEQTQTTIAELARLYDDETQIRLAEDGREDAPRMDPPPRFLGPFAYPRNPVGKGYFIDLDRARADGAELPRIEDPADRLVPERLFLPSPFGWIDAPIPGSLGWLQHSWYPRYARFVGPLLQHDDPTKPIRETELGDGDDLIDMPPRGMDRVFVRALQGAAPGLARVRLQGNEPIELRNLHRSEPSWRFELPGQTPEITLQPPGLQTLRPKAVLQTVRIEPDRDLLSLTWCAAVPLMAEVGQDFLEQTLLGVRFR